MANIFWAKVYPPCSRWTTVVYDHLQQACRRVLRLSSVECRVLSGSLLVPNHLKKKEKKRQISNHWIRPYAHTRIHTYAYIHTHIHTTHGDTYFNIKHTEDLLTGNVHSDRNQMKIIPWPPWIKIHTNVMSIFIYIYIVVEIEKRHNTYSNDIL